MKHLFLLMVCASILVCTPEVHAQTAAKAGKAIKALVKKTPKKAVNKTKIKTTPKLHPKTFYVECGKCNGKGKYSVWNSYYQCYQTQTCSRCNGTGRVKYN